MRKEFADKRKQSLKQRLIDAVDNIEPDEFCFECGGRPDSEFIAIIEKVFNEK